jgi:two-component system chemotaxis sensor kinase CheA
MENEQLIRRLMATFREELEEHVRAFNRDLLALKKEPPDPERGELLKTLFRTVHSLKGAARSVNLSLLEGACHRLEEILAAVRDGRRALDTDLFALLFTTADAFEEAGIRLREHQELAGGPLTVLLPRLDEAARQKTLAPPARVGAPSPHAAEPRRDGAATLRVAADKVDALLDRSGELLVARRRLRAWSNTLGSLRDLVGRWRAEWQGIERPLARFLVKKDGAPRVLPGRAARVLGRAGQQLRHLDRELDRLASNVSRDGRLIGQVAGALDDSIRRVRMLPFAHACEGLERTAHDLAQAAGKAIDFVLEGGDVELDRSVLEGLKDPLLHLVRNAVDHGAEAAPARRSAGKGPRTRVRVAAVLRGAQVEVAVADDGRGLNLPALRAAAQQRGLPAPDDERELARLVFVAGLSTARQVSAVSGRGVGLDCVKSQVEALHGTVEVTSARGQGTRFTLAVPLTLTTLRALLVTAAEQPLAFVGTNVQKLLRFAPQELPAVEGRHVVVVGGAPLPVASLAATLGLAPRDPAPGDKVPAVVVAAGERRMVFTVDRFLAEQEIVVKNLGRRVRRLRHVSGTTMLPSGQLALVLNAAQLVSSALARPTGRSLTAPSAAAPARKRILLAEDSVTTRTLEKSILEAAGYEVLAAVDGAEAWRLLQEHGADLLVADLEMPRLDGLALTRQVRASPRFRDLPVVLVTAQGSEQARAAGAEAGANAYLVKSAFDQRSLLATIARLL